MRKLTSIFYCLLLGLLAAACSSEPPAQQSPPPPLLAAPGAPDTLAATRPAPVPADSLATYSWESEMCQFSGRYNPRSYSPAQLDGTWDVLSHSALLDYHSSAHTPAAVAKLSLDSLDQYYTRARTHYLSLPVVPRPVWQQLRQARLRELEAEYQAKKLLIQAFATPVVLRAATPAGCMRYVQGLLQQNDSLTRRDWRRLLEEQVQRNSSPQYLVDRFEEQAASPDWLAYAKVDLLTFGWWNCVNESLYRAEPTGKMHQQFAQLFTAVKTDCEAVD